MSINKKLVSLKEIERTDAELLMILNNDCNVARYVVGNPTIVTIDEQMIWMDKIKLERDKKRFIVQYADKGVGTIVISDINMKQQTANMNIKLLSEMRGKGIGKISMRQALRYCFDELKLCYITTNILFDNRASLALFESLGFKRGKTLKDYIVKDGVKKDLIGYYISKEDFLE